MPVVTQPALCHRHGAFATTSQEAIPMAHRYRQCARAMAGPAALAGVSAASPSDE